MATVMSFTAVTFTAIAIEYTGKDKNEDDNFEKSRAQLGMLFRGNKPSKPQEPKPQEPQS